MHGTFRFVCRWEWLRTRGLFHASLFAMLWPNKRLFLNFQTYRGFLLLLLELSKIALDIETQCSARTMLGRKMTQHKPNRQVKRNMIFQARHFEAANHLWWKPTFQLSQQKIAFIFIRSEVRDCFGAVQKKQPRKCATATAPQKTKRNGSIISITHKHYRGSRADWYLDRQHL